MTSACGSFPDFLKRHIIPRGEKKLLHILELDMKDPWSKNLGRSLSYSV